jgi:hypothetical protein
MPELAVLEAGKAAMLGSCLQELSRYVKIGLHHQSLCYRGSISRPYGLPSTLSKALLLTEQLGYMRNYVKVQAANISQEKVWWVFQNSRLQNRLWLCVSGVEDNLAPYQDIIVLNKKTRSHNQRSS